MTPPFLVHPWSGGNSPPVACAPAYRSRPPLPTTSPSHKDKVVGAQQGRVVAAAAGTVQHRPPVRETSQHNSGSGGPHQPHTIINSSLGQPHSHLTTTTSSTTPGPSLSSIHLALSHVFYQASHEPKDGKAWPT